MVTYYRTDLKNTTLENDDERYVEIYKITNKITNKLYIGQAISHILNRKKFRPHGMEKRFLCHISEAFSNKKNQSYYLNNAIRKYGKENFTLELLKICSVNDSDYIETDEILKNNSLYPNGYNLKTGGKVFKHTTESKKRVSNGVVNYFKNKRFERFKNVLFDDDDDNFNSYLKKSGSNGWFVIINGKKASFEGVCNNLEENKLRALEFIKDLKEISTARYLDAGNPLEP